MVVLVFPIIHVNVYLIYGLGLTVKHVREYFTLHIYFFLFIIAGRILWTFDGNVDDFYNNFPGTPINAPTYSSPGINGYGTCLYLNSSHNQSVTVYSPPFLNMAYTSFSLVAWVKPTTLRNGTFSSQSDNAIFGQHQDSSNDHSFHVVIRQKKSYLGFYGGDSQGNIMLNPGNWYHVCIYIYLFRIIH